jgi:hypothetical protein
MRTVTFKSVLHGVASSLGLDPATNFTSAQAEGLTRYINKHLRRAWEIYPWPDVEVYEQRFCRDAWSSSTTYALGAQVVDPSTGIYYQSVQSANTNRALTLTAWWTPIALSEFSIPFEQTGKTAIGEVLAIYASANFLSGEGHAIPFYITADEVAVFPAQLGFVPRSFFVRFRARPSEMSATMHSPLTTYAAGDRVYLAATGQTYRALATNTNQVPNVAPTFWAVEPFPYVLAPYVTHAAYADALREDGQHDKARVERSEAEGLLEDEMDKINTQQNQTARSYVRA